MSNPNPNPTPPRCRSPRIAPPLFAGVDVGGTHIKLGIVDDGGGILAQATLNTRSFEGPADAMQAAGATLRDLLNANQRTLRDLQAIGLGVPGPMDIPSGLILTPGNLPTWRNAPVRDQLAQACEGLPVIFTNDANAAAFGEYWIGVAKDCGSMALLTLGTGVGGGIIVAGQCIEGAHSSAAEIGHICIDRRMDARRCPCGQRGHLEAYASATALTARTREKLPTAERSSLQGALDGGEEITALLIYQHATQGDALALRMILETADYLAWGIADLVQIVDPEIVVLGGAMNFGGMQSEIGRQFLARVEKGVRDLTFSVISEKLRIVYSQLGSDAGFIGAAGLARHRTLRAATLTG